jgi:glycosyltransferase involved in cell wall biosynthesis
MDKKPKKILIFSLSYLPKMVGGAEIAIKEITDRIQESNIEFSMITLRYDSLLPKFEKNGKIKVYRIGFSKKNPNSESLVKFPMYLNKVFYPILATIKAFSLDRKEKFDGFWSMMLLMSIPPMLFNLFFRKKPYIISIQEGDDVDKFMSNWFMRPFKNTVIKSLHQASSVQSISEFLSGWVRNLGYAGSLSVIPNGVDLQKFSRNESYLSKASEVRKTLGIFSEDFLIISISRLVYKNGLDTLIDSMKFLDIKFKLLIIGEGHLKENLTKKISENKLEDRVFLLGQKSQEEIPIYLNSANVFCRPSRTEGQGISFLEAMATELPVVATSVGGIKEFLIDKKTGLVSKVNDAEDLANKIKTLAVDELLRNKIKTEAYKMVKTKYNWDKLVLDMQERFFARILKN